LPVLVIITGPACTGKTTLGRWLAEASGLPFFYKDGFKEMMYDVVIEQQGMEGITPEVTRMLGRMSVQSLLIVVEQLLSQGLSLIIEANFDRALFSPALNEIRQRFPCQIVQAQLKCEGTTLLERFIRREQEDRHPGHQGLKHMERMQPVLLRGEQEPLDVEGDLLVFDTTDFEQADYKDLLTLVQKRLGAAPDQGHSAFRNCELSPSPYPLPQGRGS
jgi:predicted kinase